MARERNGAATVVSDGGGRVQVEHRGTRLTARMEGFPAGFRLRQGDRVILLDEPAGTVARPLVRAVSARFSAADLKGRRGVVAQGRRLELQAATQSAQPSQSIDNLGDGEYTAWVVERAADDAVGQVVAVAPLR